jgi:regulator of protease activity HflC (stomatin/prohibitin superfamily)
MLLILIVLVAIIGISCIVIVPQAEAYVVERLGAYKTTMRTGVNFKLPILDNVVKKVTLKEFIQDYPPQRVITKDNVTMEIDTVVYMTITDPKLYTYGVQNPMSAVENLTATTLRNVIGEMDLDATLTARDQINSQIRQVIDQATDPWGIKVNRVEVKNIIPPRDIQEAMEKQMRAERERREKILQAEGAKKAAILTAEGEKEAKVLRAEADKQATILAAEANKEARIKEAEGQAQAILQLYEAQAEGIRKIKEANPSQEYLALEGLKTYEKLADGKATKIVVPSNLQDMTANLTNIKEIVKE